MNDQYFCVAASAVGNPEAGYGFTYAVDPKSFTSPAAAWRYGLRHLDRSDDFNVGVLRDGRWVATLWGPDAEVVDDDPLELRDIPLPEGVTE